jgi:hypothetical protein
MKAIITSLLLIFVYNLQARTWIVSNEPGFPGDFSDLQACINTAVNGDIILVQGSAVSYGDIEIRKRLIIMGPGYFLGQNPQTQVNLANARLNSISILNGSMGAIIQGLEVTGSKTIESYSTGVGSIEDAGIIVDSTNALIMSCLVHNSVAIKNSVGTLLRKSYVKNYVFCWQDVNGCRVDNSIVLGLYVKNTEVSNCIVNFSIAGGGHYTNSIFQNNIFGYQGGVHFFVDFDSCVFNNNILTNDFLGTHLGSNTISTYPELYIGYAIPGKYSPDAVFQLAPRSPAIGFGINGIDCGPFGGSDPYRLSGISFHPNIWSVTMPNTATSGGGLQIQLKVNANN